MERFFFFEANYTPSGKKFLFSIFFEANRTPSGKKFDVWMTTPLSAVATVYTKLVWL